MKTQSLLVPGSSFGNYGRSILWQILATLLFFMIFALCSSAALANKETALLPEVEAILFAKQPSEEDMRQNAYVGLVGLNALAGEDFMEVGRFRVLEGVANWQRIMNTKDLNMLINSKNLPDAPWEKGRLQETENIRGSRLVYPCWYLDMNECLNDTLKQREDFSFLIQQNAVLMQRYLHIVRLPDYHSYNHYLIESDISSYADFMVLSRLCIAQAVLVFGEGDVELALNILVEEMDFLRKMYAASRSNANKHFASSILYAGYHTISALLDEPGMQPYLDDARIAAMLKPLTTDEQKGAAQVFRSEQASSIYMVYLLEYREETFNEENEPLVLFIDNLFLNMKQHWYNQNTSSNLQYLLYEEIMKRAPKPVSGMAGSLRLMFSLDETLRKYTF